MVITIATENGDRSTELSALGRWVFGEGGGVPLLVDVVRVRPAFSLFAIVELCSAHEPHWAGLMAELMFVKQGAEARVFKTEFLGRPTIVKERFSKGYRHPALDKNLTTKRTNQEVRAIVRCRKAGVACPAVYFLDQQTHTIYMEDIVGAESVRDFIIRATRAGDRDSVLRVATLIGQAIARIHDADVIHGDLTTSNMLIRNAGDPIAAQVFLIDFGLSSLSSSAEDKGVDLYVLERAFLSTHPNSEAVFAQVLKVYQGTGRGASAALSKLDEVRLRGRKRTMVG